MSSFNTNFQDFAELTFEPSTFPYHRNVSSPFSLATPQRSQRQVRRDTPILDPDTLDRLSEKDRIKPLDNLSFPKKARVVSEKPVWQNPEKKDGECSSTTSSRHVQIILPVASERENPLFELNDRVVALAVTFTLAIILAIGIPLGIILPQKYIIPLPVKVLVPFYVDPEGGSWKRLFESIVKHHDMQFIVIVRPESDPANFTLPAHKYIEAMKDLRLYPNVQTLGYIDTARGTVASSIVRDQIANYADWSNGTQGLALHGVYFDQTPWEDDGNGTWVAYLRNIGATVRHTTGWASASGGLVAHNPGRVPSPELVSYEPDIVVVYNGTYEDMPLREDLHTKLAELRGRRDDYAMLVHGVPKDIGRVGLRKIVEKVRRDIEWLYVTDLTEKTGYGSFWEEWLDVAW